MSNTSTNSDNLFCTFYSGGIFFGIPAKEVQEVIRGLNITRVPLAPQAVVGLINLRGQILCAVDICDRLQLKSETSELSSSHIIINNGASNVSFLAEKIGDVIEIDKKLKSDVPEGVNLIAKECISCVYKLPDKILHILDIKNICEIKK